MMVISLLSKLAGALPAAAPLSGIMLANSVISKLKAIPDTVKDPKAYTPEGQAALLKRFQEGSLREKGASEIADAMRTYFSARAKDATAFEGLKIGDKTLTERIAVFIPPEGQAWLLQQAREAHNTGIVDALKMTEATTAAQRKFEATLEVVDNYLKDPETRYDSRAVATYLQEQKSTGVELIKAQQKAELDALKQYVESPEFEARLRTGLALADTDSLVGLKKEMLSTLEERHKKELKDFEDASNKAIEQMMKEAQLRMATISLLAALHDGQKIVRQQIQALASKGKPISLSITESSDPSLAGIKITDVKLAALGTGAQIERTGDVLKVEMPNRLFSPLYYGRFNSKLNADMMTLALAIKASGHEAITMTVDHHDEKYSMEMARVAYEACRKAGYPEDKITIQINAADEKSKAAAKKAVSKDVMFASCPSRLQALNKAVERDEAHRKKLTDTAAVKPAEMRRLLEEHRRGYVPAAAPPPAAPPPAAAP